MSAIEAAVKATKKGPGSATGPLETRRTGTTPRGRFPYRSQAARADCDRGKIADYGIRFESFSDFPEFNSGKFRIIRK
jgi:hypothetical protein